MIFTDADLARAIIQALPLQRSDLVRADHLALTLLLSSSPDGLAVGEIAKALGLHTRTVTELVNRLVQSGYVLRAPHPKDARHVLVRLTPKGWLERARERRRARRAT